MAVARVSVCAGLAGFLTSLVVGSAAYAAAAIPDLSGTYWATSYSPKIQVLGGGDPPLSEAGKAAYRKNQAGLKDGSIIDPARKVCLPDGVPRILETPYPFEVFQLPPGQVTFVHELNHQIRPIPLDQPLPSYEQTLAFLNYGGHSSGHYEGDTLVIDTVGMKVGPFSMVDMYGTPQSPALHVIERYRLIDYDLARDAFERNAKENLRASGGGEFDPNYRGKVLQLQFTVEDENVFTMPWSATITYRPAVSPRTDLICAENPLEPGGKLSMVPRADKPDF